MRLVSKEWAKSELWSALNKVLVRKFGSWVSDRIKNILIKNYIIHESLSDLENFSLADRKPVL